jgi:hypothetical protein
MWNKLANRILEQRGICIIFLGKIKFIFCNREITKPINNNHVTRDKLRYLGNKRRQAVAGCIYV